MAFEKIVERVSLLREKIEATVTFGRPEHAPWSYLPEMVGMASKPQLRDQPVARR